MSAVLVIIHVIVCIVLIAVVLLQRGKGAEIGAVFGGGASSTVFGSRGAGNFLTKLTTGSAVIYMLTSLSLSYVWTQDAENRLFSEEALESEAAQPLAPADENLFEQIGTVPADEALVEEAAAPQATLEEGSLPPLAEPGDTEQAP